MSRTATIKGLNTHLDKLDELDVEQDDLTRACWATEAYTGDEADDVVRALGAREMVRAVDFSRVPVPALQDLAQQVNRLWGAFEKIKEMGPEELFKANPKDQRRQLKQELDNAEQALLARLASLLALQLHRARDETLSTRSQELDNVLAESRKAKAELDEVLEAARGDVGKLGASKHAENFDVIAKSYQESARNWLIVTITLIAAWFAAAVFLYRDTDSTLSYAKVAMRVAMLFAGLGAVAWAAAQYRANRHNQVVNKHRKTALDTFETFVQAATDEDTKQAVLLQATHTIFVPGQSGYAKESPPPMSPATTVVEVLKRAGKDSGG